MKHKVSLCALILSVFCSSLSAVEYTADSGKSLEEVLEETSSTGKLVIIDFYAPWCGPCKLMTKSLAAFETEFEAQVVVLKVNVSTHSDIATRYSIRSIPTLHIYRENEKVGELIGFDSDKLLRESLLEFIPNAAQEVAQ